MLGLTPALMVLAASAPAQQVKAYDGIMNPEFDETVAGQMSFPPISPVDGVFWVGAETHTLVEGAGPDRYLRLEPQQPTSGEPWRETLVYQRVGAHRNHTNSLKLNANVRVPVVGQEARITISESLGRYWNMQWHLKDNPFQYPGEPTNSAWTFFENVWNGTNWVTQPMTFNNPSPGSTTWTGNDPDPIPGAVNNRVDFVEWSVYTHSVGTPLNRNGWVEGRWTAPNDGWVRIVHRPWRRNFGSGPVESFTFELWHRPPASAARLLRSEFVDRFDTNGPQIVERCEVLAGDTIAIRVSKNDPSNAPGLQGVAAGFVGHPTIAYEGRSLTLRIGQGLQPIVATQDERFLIVPVTADPTAWQSISNFDLSAALYTAFGGTGSPPANWFVAPFDVKLSVPGTNGQGGAVEFDDVSCMVDWDVFSPDEVRNDILKESSYARTWDLAAPALINPQLPPSPSNIKFTGRLDHPTYGKTRGNLASFYAGHNLFIREGVYELPAFSATPGPHPATGLPMRFGPPFGLWPILKGRYLLVDHDHLFATERAENSPLNASPRGFPYESFNVDSDLYETSASQYGGGSGEIGISGVLRILELYDATNDITFLDRAFEVIAEAVPFGQVHSDFSQPLALANWGVEINRTQMMGHSGFHINVPPDERAVEADDQFDEYPLYYKAWQHVEAPALALDTYARCRMENERLKAALGPGNERYLPSTLDFWLARVDLTIGSTKGGLYRTPRNYASTTNQFGWSGRWQSYHGEFNDNWGNQERDTMRAYKSLLELEAAVGGLTTAEQSVRDKLLTYWLDPASQTERSGTYHYLLDSSANIWGQGVARSELVAGDQIRAYDAFAFYDTASPHPYHVFGDQIRTVAEYAVKFQYPTSSPNGGVWTQGALDRYQFLDISLGFGGGLGAMGNYAGTAAMAAGLATTSAADRERLLAYLWAYLDTNAEHFGERSNPGLYGYWHHADRDQAPLPSISTSNNWTDVPSGFEWRSLDSFLIGLEQGAFPLAETIESEIMTKSLTHVSGSQNYTFRVTVKDSAGVSFPQYLDDMLNPGPTQEPRARVLHVDWTFLPPMVKEYWPNTTQVPVGLTFSTPQYTSVSPNEAYAEITLQNVPAPTAGQRWSLEFVTSTEVTTARPYATWSHDTSVQEGP